MCALLACKVLFLLDRRLPDVSALVYPAVYEEIAKDEGPVAKLRKVVPLSFAAFVHQGVH